MPRSSPPDYVSHVANGAAALARRDVRAGLNRIRLFLPRHGVLVLGASIASAAVAVCSTHPSPLARSYDWVHAHEGIVLIAWFLSVGIGVTIARKMRSSAMSLLDYRELIEQGADAVLIVEPLTCRILYMNAALSQQLGVEPSDAPPATAHDVFMTNGESMLQINARLSGGRSLSLLLRGNASHKTGVEMEVRWMPLRRDKQLRWAYVARDVSRHRQNERELIEKQQHLDHLANHDQLTGLPNRHYMSTFLPDALSSAKAAGQSIGIVYLDLDRFKLINDTQGHEIGDQLLKVVAQRLSECVRDLDIVVRMGGDEFIIVLIDIVSYDEVSRTAERIIESLAKPIALHDRRLQTTASIGISLFPRDGHDLTSLLKHADTAMYQAKDRGRNNVQVFTPLMNRKLKQRVTVEVMLREALSRGHLDVYYQPLVNLRSRLIVGLEALIRWKHPVRGMIPADWFIGVAEETGLIIPIGEFVLRRAMDDMSTWREAGAKLVPVSLNVAASQMLRGDFSEIVTRELAEHSIDPALLQLEMTERALFDIRMPQSGEQRPDSMARLREQGIRVAIDDFGTGYSSLAYLKTWQVDTLKIDRSFIRDLGANSSDFAIVSAIVAMAKQLKIEVVAEGIEGFQQDEILNKLGCHQGQGYLYGRPSARDECLRMLRGRRADTGYICDDSVTMGVMSLG